MKQIDSETIKRSPTLHEQVTITTFVDAGGKKHYLLDIMYMNGHSHFNEMYTNKKDVQKELTKRWKEWWDGKDN